MTRVKICGIRNESERDCVVSAGADAIGFVVEIPISRRSISKETARSLIEGLSPFVTSVIVTAPDSVEEAANLARATRADVIQVHDTLGLEDLKELQKRIPQKIVAATAVHPDAEENLQVLADVADAVLLDTFKKGKLGGTGEVHDWNVSAGLVRDLNVPVILAGGLDSENVAQAVKRVRPYAVDVSSGVETDGKKDCQKVNTFVKGVRSCQLQ
ncbi:MAG: phosphoribosylanthranilate isomerase [Methanotrichaceae archaeon]